MMSLRAKSFEQAGVQFKISNRIKRNNFIKGDNLLCSASFSMNNAFAVFFKKEKK